MPEDSGKVCSLPEAVRAHVHPGDSVHVVTGHGRWTAGARELVRQFWGTDPGFTLVMLSLSSLGTLFFRGGLVRKVVTGYSGDTFPNFTPNPVFASAYRSGEVEVEHWSFLSLVQRLEAGARGLPAIVTRSVAGSSMEGNEAFATVASPFGQVGLLAPLVADVALVHGGVADRAGNIAMEAPLLEGVWGALGARRGVIATVERIVDDIRPWSHMVRIPGHRVLAVSEVPMGAHPGGQSTRFLPVEPYGEDIDFWCEARDASRTDDFDDWIRRWVLEPVDQADYLARLGEDRVQALRAKADPESWRADQEANPVDLDAPVNGWERATVFGARHLADRLLATGADCVLAGAGVANLAAWLAVARARQAGSQVELAAELGLLGYAPTPADPYVFNHRNFPTATMVADASTVLGMLMSGPGTVALACLGAAQIDRFGAVNSTLVPGGAFLVGSGGGNDVASTALEAVVVATLTPQRTPATLGYVTSPGRAVSALATDLGLFEKDGSGELVLVAVPEGDDIAASVARAREACGWELRVGPEVRTLPSPEPGEIAALRAWDPKGTFLRAR